MEDVRRFFAQSCDFVLAAAQPEHFGSIPVDLPEVAFWGRSNVGKSSLINAVTGRKGLARASNTPGRTQQIVFFNMAGKLLFADLPGYGHAKAPKAEKKAKAEKPLPKGATVVSSRSAFNAPVYRRGM